MKSLLRLILLITLLPAVAAAQPDMIVEHYTKESGLPSNTVYCAQKDGDGFVWFGTWHGLCSFDGTTFTPFITRTTGRTCRRARCATSLATRTDICGYATRTTICICSTSMTKPTTTYTTS